MSSEIRRFICGGTPKVELFRAGTVTAATRRRALLVVVDIAAATACLGVILRVALAVKTRSLVRGALMAAPLLCLATLFLGPSSPYR